MEDQIQANLETSSQQSAGQQSQATPNPTPAPVAQPAATAGQSVVEQALQKADAAAQAAKASGEATAPTYQPNFKFKAADKEMEFDEFLRGAIKEEAHEKKLRELYEKAYGIDFVKQHRDKIRTEYQEYRKQWDPIETELKQLGLYVKNQDVFGALQAIGFNQETLLNAARERVEYLQMPAEQRMKLDAQAQERNRLYALEMENQQLKQQYSETAIQGLHTQFVQTMERNDVKGFAEQYEARTGKPGSFQDQVIRYGDYLEKTQGKVFPPEYVVQEFMKLAGYQPQSQQMQQVAGATVVQNAQAAPVVVEPPKEKPTIKNIQGKSTSVVKKQYRSLDELREKYKQVQAQ